MFFYLLGAVFSKLTRRRRGLCVYDLANFGMAIGDLIDIYAEVAARASGSPSGLAPVDILFSVPLGPPFSLYFDRIKQNKIDLSNCASFLTQIPTLGHFLGASNTYIVQTKEDFLLTMALNRWKYGVVYPNLYYYRPSYVRGWASVVDLGRPPVAGFLEWVSKRESGLALRSSYALEEWARSNANRLRRGGRLVVVAVRYGVSYYKERNSALDEISALIAHLLLLNGAQLLFIGSEATQPAVREMLASMPKERYAIAKDLNFNVVEEFLLIRHADLFVCGSVGARSAARYSDTPFVAQELGIPGHSHSEFLVQKRELNFGRENQVYMFNYPLNSKQFFDEIDRVYHATARRMS